MASDLTDAMDFLKRAINKTTMARVDLNDMSRIVLASERDMSFNGLKKAWDHLGEALSLMQRWALDNK